MNSNLIARDHLDLVAQMMSDTATTDHAQQLLWSLRALNVPCRTIGDLAEMNEARFYRIATFIETCDEPNPNALIVEARDNAFDAATNNVVKVAEIDGQDWFVFNGMGVPVIDAILSELSFPSHTDVEASWVCGEGGIEWTTLSPADLAAAE